MQSKWQDKFSAKPSKGKDAPAEDEGVETIVYITGEDMEGRPQWAYALIHADKYLEFKEAEAAGNYQLADYGKVLHFGFGTEPPEEIKKEMADQYACNEKFEQEIEDMLVDILEQFMPEILDNTKQENQE